MAKGGSNEELYTPRQAAARARRLGIEPGARGNRVRGGTGSRRNLRTARPVFTRQRTTRRRRGTR